MSSEQTKKDADKKSEEARDMRDIARKEKRQEEAAKKVQEKKDEVEKKKSSEK